MREINKNEIQSVNGGLGAVCGGARIVGAAVARGAKWVGKKLSSKTSTGIQAAATTTSVGEGSDK